MDAVAVMCGKMRFELSPTKRGIWFVFIKYSWLLFVSVANVRTFQTTFPSQNLANQRRPYKNSQTSDLSNH